ncbi:hypothetical protein [Methylophaga nitratireducenticrescens]|uniref:Uncharacterized protein n=1 Tax=Methylophaga nitratireducenticrescens TaxID=754476 RepID=I1XN66_METNJ|nr:hypothetical protein [Methylophaga nitratireducenticrescens]AFI85835.1 hypothetical protein Q7A_3062 [Methylophaga nitratireducenticrescens]AUZ85545.1 hypothetical protein CDW43_13665 [Methylophaga nitratireducenticrescens]
MTEMMAPQDHEKTAARMPHDIFLTNLIVNHILLFTAIAATGKSYFEFIVLVPLFSFIFLGYTFVRSSRIKREGNEFVYVHWQIARRWSFFFTIILSFVVTVAVLGWLSYTYLGLMKEAAFALVGGLSFLPTLISVLILIVIEMEALHHARVGTLPEWAKRRFLIEK